MPATHKDVCCITCGYMLVGLQPRGRCSECGTPIWRSHHGNRRLLELEDRVLERKPWNRRNRNGAILLASFAILGAIALFALLVRGSFPSPATESATVIMLASALTNCVVFAVLAMMFHGRIAYAESIERYRSFGIEQT